MKQFLIILFFAFINGTLTAQSNKSIKQFEWLLGTWAFEGHAMQESWKQIDDTTLLGTGSHFEKGGKEVIDETVKLVYRKGDFFYIPLVHDQNDGKEVEFKVVSLSATSFTAENLLHDFPQRITYELKDPKHLAAHIEGNVKGKVKRIDFDFRKK